MMLTWLIQLTKKIRYNRQEYEYQRQHIFISHHQRVLHHFHVEYYMETPIEQDSRNSSNHHECNIAVYLRF